MGKSSLINTLWGHDTAKTSNTPGKTQGVMVSSFVLKDYSQTLGPFYLFDLPGYGAARVSKKIKQNWNELMGAFFNRLTPRSMIVHVRDARHPEEESDDSFENFVSYREQRKVLVFNKIDKLRGQKERASFERAYKEKVKNGVDIYCVSATKKNGISKFEQALVQFLQKT